MFAVVLVGAGLEASGRRRAAASPILLIRRLIDRALAGSADSSAAGHAAIDLAFGAAPEIELADRAAGGRDAHLAAIWGREA